MSNLLRTWDGVRMILELSAGFKLKEILNF